MKDLVKLLEDINTIRVKHEKEASKISKFNIFSTLHKEHDERRLHSRFISVLLQPMGTHGQGDLFINQFIDVLNNYEYFDISIDYDRTKVYPSERDKKENNNIDILIIDRHNKLAVIIENKIYAGDSNNKKGGQLERYIDHVVKQEGIKLENIFTIYLSLDGHQPSEKSIRKYKNNAKWDALSYEELIITWLTKCINSNQINDPFLTSVINQYIKLLNKMTGNTISVDEILEYQKLIGGTEEGLKSTKRLMDAFKEIQKHSVHQFWSKLIDIIEKNEYEITQRFKDDSIKALTHFYIYKKGIRKRQYTFIAFKITNGVVVRIVFSPYINRFYTGISRKANEGFDNIIENKEKLEDLSIKLNDLNKDYQKNNVNYVEKHFTKNIVFNDFSKKTTFDLINPKRQDVLVERTWKEVEELINLIEDNI